MPADAIAARYKNLANQAGWDIRPISMALKSPEVPIATLRVETHARRYGWAPASAYKETYVDGYKRTLGMNSQK
jgi:hypothetical protein